MHSKTLSGHVVMHRVHYTAGLDVHEMKIVSIKIYRHSASVDAREGLYMYIERCTILCSELNGCQKSKQLAGRPVHKCIKYEIEIT